MRENYWSFRKAVPRYNLAAAFDTAWKSPQQVDTSLPPLHPSPEPVPVGRAVRKRIPLPKTHIQSFRYSYVAESVINLLDKVAHEEKRDKILRRIPKILPALEVKDFKVTRKRSQKSVRIHKGAAKRDTSLPVMLGRRRGRGVDARLGRFEDWLLTTMAQYRSACGLVICRQSGK
ncbi:hypothetical protein ACOMHN_015529 [Nucella lapillus]